jgi:hypothetical protein
LGLVVMENRQNHSQEFPDDSIRRFLLGQLRASEQKIFEEQLFINGDLEARLRLAEFELADDYAFKRLTESETKAFRERYLLTTERNQKLNVSQAIRDRFLSEPIAEIKPTVYQRLMPWFDLRRPAWRYAFATLILVLILGTVFLVTKETRIVKWILPERFRPRPHASPTPQLMNHPPGSSSPVHDEPSPPAESHELPLLVSLTATSSIDQSPVITLPVDENALVRFQLLIKDGGQEVYRADLLSTAGETLFSAGSLKSFGAKPASISFDVPAKALQSGQYQIRLTRTDDQGKAGSSQYYVRVQ